MKRTIPFLFAFLSATLSQATLLKYDGLGAVPSDWHDATNWLTDILPGPADDVEINRNNYPGNIATTNAVTLNSFLFKNGGDQTVTIGNDFSTVSNFQILANNGSASIISVQNPGTAVNVGGNALLSVLANGTLSQSWSFTLNTGTVMNVASNLDLKTTTASPNACTLQLWNADLNVNGNFTMAESGTSVLNLSYKSWLGQVAVGGTATLGGHLLIENGFSGTNQQYVLLKVTSAKTLAGSFENATFGTTTYQNGLGSVYKLELAALDGDFIYNDIILRLSSLGPEVKWYPSISPTTHEDFRSVLGAVGSSGLGTNSVTYELVNNAGVFRLMGDRVMVDYGKQLEAVTYQITVRATNGSGGEALGNIPITVAEGEPRDFEYDADPADHPYWIYYIQRNPTAWLAANFTPEERANPAISGWDADPDHDNIPNWLEYQFGTDGKTPDDIFRPRSVLSNGVWTMTFPVNPTATEPLLVEVTSDLMSGIWSTTPVQWYGDSGVSRTVQDLNPDGSPHRFIRFRSQNLFP